VSGKGRDCSRSAEVREREDVSEAVREATPEAETGAENAGRAQAMTTGVIKATLVALELALRIETEIAVKADIHPALLQMKDPPVVIDEGAETPDLQREKGIKRVGAPSVLDHDETLLQQSQDTRVDPGLQKELETLR
jgi:hypothetical protein